MINKNMTGGGLKMDETIRYHDTSPDTNLMMFIAMTGYSLSELLSELSDNSIDEMLEKIKLAIDIAIADDEITVLDNARGMTESELAKAMILGRVTKGIGRLGLYGIGLKAACVGLGNHFEITSLANGSKKAYATWWDKEEWEMKRKWEAPTKEVPIPDELKKTGHGTLIKVTRLNMKTGNKIGTARADLGRRFSPYINRKIIDIKINEESCRFKQPDLIKGSKRDISIETPSGAKMYGWVGLLEHSSQKGFYGFDTFRYDRLITCYDKFGFSAHPNHARIIGELHMSHIPVTMNKREWNKESKEYEEAFKCVSVAIKDIISESVEMAKEKKIDTTVVNKIEQFKEGLCHAMQCDELKEYTLPERGGPKPSEEEPPLVPKSPRDITIIKVPAEIEKRDKPAEPEKGTKEPADTGRKRIPKKTHMVTRNQITVKGRKFDYHYEWSKYGSNGPIYEKDYNKESRNLNIYINKDFPSVKVTNDMAFYAFTFIVEAVAEVMVEEAKADENKFDEIRQILLRESSKYVKELREDDDL